MQIVIAKASLKRIDQTKGYVLTRNAQTKAISISISINNISFIKATRIGGKHLDLVEKAEIYPKAIYQNQQENQKVR